MAHLPSGGRRSPPGGAEPKEIAPLCFSAQRAGNRRAATAAWFVAVHLAAHGQGGGCSTMTAAATEFAPIGNGFIIDRLNQARVIVSPAQHIDPLRYRPHAQKVIWRGPLEISSSGAICVHLILCNIAVAIANPSGDRMVKLLRFHGSRTELEGITMDFKTFIDDLSAGYRKLAGQTSSSKSRFARNSCRCRCGVCST